jgi:hypothetical protein
LNTTKKMSEKEEFDLAMLNEHNALRARFGNVKPLELDAELSELAQKHTEYLAAKQLKLENTTNDQIGENLYFLQSTEGTYTAKQVMDYWLKRSDFNEVVKPNKTNHFTQIVWRKTLKMGVGVSKAVNGAVYVAVFYSPRGNITNYLADNVIFAQDRPVFVDSNILESIDSLFKKVDRDKSGKISLTKTKELFNLINKTFNQSYKLQDAKKIFENLTNIKDGKVDLETFKSEFKCLKPMVAYAKEIETQQ